MKRGNIKNHSPTISTSVQLEASSVSFKMPLLFSSSDITNASQPVLKHKFQWLGEQSEIYLKLSHLTKLLENS
jgi:hypothetical protein